MRTFLLAGAVACLLALCWYSSPGTLQVGGVDAGAELFLSHCQGCHQLPDPADLPYTVWVTVVLPRMRELMSGNGTLTGGALTTTEWTNLTEYILRQAPDTLPLQSRTYGEASGFTATFPGLFLSPPSTSYLSVVPGRGLILADINKESLFIFDDQLKPTQRIFTGRGITDLQTFAGHSYATVIGSFSPTDEGVGQLLRLRADGLDTLATGLLRPTSLLILDDNHDGEPEFIVTEYGKWAGSVRRYLRGPEGSYESTTISSRTGPISVQRESDDSFLVLYGQGDERIARYRRSDAYREETLLRFPPSYGSSSLRVIDWNGDQLPDLIHTCGDLADYPSDPKPYHGIRIYTGLGDGTYDLQHFIPLPGAYGCEVADFNQDGRKDIAAISFFPDYRRSEPPSAVVFYGSPSGWLPHFLPVSQAGRWIRLTAGDIDGDGDIDLAAGSLAMEPYPDSGQLQSWLGRGLPLICWKNQVKHNSPH